MDSLLEKVRNWLNESNPEISKDPTFQTHPWLTLRSIQLFEQYYNIKLGYYFKEQIILGSIEEDFDIIGTSSIYDYAHLLTSEILDLSSSNAIDFNANVNRAENHFMSSDEDIEGLSDEGDLGKILVNFKRNKSALAWAKDDYNSTNFKMAVYYGGKNDKLGWRYLGHILHLLQDMSVPAHVRNDVHIINTDNYEYFLKLDVKNANIRTPFDYMSIIGSNLGSPVVNSDIDPFFKVLSLYTRSNYFSDSTVFKNFHYVSLPVAEVKSEDDDYLYNSQGKKIAYKGALYKSLQYAKAANFKQYAKIDATVTDDTFSDVGLQAIQYGAGLIKLFYDLTTFPSIDTTAPSIPTGLSATASSSSQINLSWSASTDNVGVSGYKIYRGGSYLKSVSTVATSDTGLSASTQYCYTVSAYDAAGNESGQSTQACATTTALPDLTGTWSGTWASAVGVNNGNLTASLTQSGSSISGSVNISGSPCISSGNVSGTVSGNNISFGVVSISGTDTIAYNGIFTATSITGTYSVTAGACAGDRGTFTSNKSLTNLTTWAKTYGNFFGSGISSIKQTNNGGYIAAGGAVDRLDANGNILWQKTYSIGSAFIAVEDMQQISDGGYIGIGDVAGNYVFLIKIYANGDVNWIKRYGVYVQNIYQSFQQTSDGGYIIAGRTYLGFNDYRMWVLKVDVDGNIQWEKTYDNWNNLASVSIQPTSDGKYIIAGGYYNVSAILKLDTDGTILWEKRYSNLGLSFGSIKQTIDGGYILVGSGIASSLYVIKLDNSGNIVWQKFLYGIISGGDSIQQTTDAGYIVAGWVMTANKYEEILVLKLDSSGNIQWQKTYGDSGSDKYPSIYQTGDGGYILTGVKGSYQGSGLFKWVLKIGSDGNIGGSCNIIDILNNFTWENSNVTATTYSGIVSTLTTTDVNSLLVTVADTNATVTTQCLSQ